MLVEIISKNAGQSQEEQRPYFPRPSDVGKCIRARVYHAMHVPRDPYPDRTILVFDDGNWHEELIKDHIRKTVWQLIELKGAQQRIKIATVGGRDMTGEIDGLLQPPVGKQLLLELKSINHFGFQRLEKAAAPQEDHRHQANLYLHGLQEAGFDIDQALIVYKNKNTAAMLEFPVDYDRGMALLDIQTYEMVDVMAFKKQLPARPYESDDWHCDYCPWQRHCWKGYVEELNSMAVGYEMEADFADAARYYRELGAQESEIKKQRDEIKGKLKTAMMAAGYREARAGEYILRITASERETIDKDLVPASAKKLTISERFDVKKIKG